jgi:hypothetical protein
MSIPVAIMIAETANKMRDTMNRTMLPSAENISLPDRLSINPRPNFPVSAHRAKLVQ